MNITIYGTGYVGLVTAACLAREGNHVLCVDINRERIDQLNTGQVPIHEPGLDELVERGRSSGRLQFTIDAKAGVAHGLLQFIAVGTPPDTDGSADLQQVLAVARSIGEHIDDYRVLVTKSTVPVGTADRVHTAVTEVLASRGSEIDFDVVSNPEFLAEGRAVADFMKPHRIVVGSDSERATTLLQRLYAPFNLSRDRMIVMNVRSAELTKYAANTMLATKISLMNELANLADGVGADIEQVRVGIGSDPRIGYDFIYPGCGYGGSCFPKDVRALASMGKVAGVEAELIRAVESVNQRQKTYLLEKLRSHFSSLDGRCIALWGLAFKPNTDDIREAPSRVLMEALWKEGATVRAYDPVAMEAIREAYGERADLILCESPEVAAQGADALVLVTEWHEFRSPDFQTLKEKLNEPVIFDGRNIYEPKLLREYGFDYYGVGRGIQAQAA